MEKSVVVPLVLFGDFVHGAPVPVRVPAKEELRPGNVIPWECGSNHGGQAEVVFCEPPQDGRMHCLIRKLCGE